MLTRAILAMFEKRDGGCFTLAAFCRILQQEQGYRLQDGTAVDALTQVARALARDGVTLAVRTTIHGTYVDLSH